MGGAAIQRLRTMARLWDEQGDRRAIFADAYGRMTAAMIAAIDGGEFEDAEWVGRLLDRFADYYFEAADAWEQGSDCPDVWCEVFEATGGSELDTLQVLFLGINAHINHDLVFALADVLADWGSLDAAARQSRHSDHSRVNVVIARTVDLVQDEVLEARSPGWNVVDVAFGRLDEWIFSRVIAGWRAHVWRDALGLIGGDNTRDGEICARVCERTSRIAHAVIRT